MTTDFKDGCAHGPTVRTMTASSTYNVASNTKPNICLAGTKPNPLTLCLHGIEVANIVEISCFTLELARNGGHVNLISAYFEIFYSATGS